MSLLTTALSKAEEAKQAGRLHAEASYEELVKMVVSEVLSDDQKKPTKAEVENTQAMIDSCIKAGVATEDKIRELIEAASQLKGHLQAGETKEIDTASLEEKFRAIADRCRAEVDAAQKAVFDARRTNLERIGSRQEAQRLLSQYPELGPLALGMKLSWTPKVSQG